MRIVTLLTDYGTVDAYVAELKAALVALARGATLVDITHEVPPGDVRAGQYLLARVWSRFPAGTIHVAVVDPGVGSPRRALAGSAAGHFFVGPDNGLLSPVPDDARWVELPIPPTAAPTFHGRDVFAPAAARLANGEHLERLGPPATGVNRSPLPAPRRDGAVWAGEVIYVDRFGTLVTNLSLGAIGSSARVVVAGRDVGPLRRMFSDVEPGHVVALLGSGGTVEIAVRDGNAARLLGAGVGTVVRA